MNEHNEITAMLPTNILAHASDFQTVSILLCLAVAITLIVVMANDMTGGGR